MSVSSLRAAFLLGALWPSFACTLVADDFNPDVLVTRARPLDAGAALDAPAAQAVEPAPTALACAPSESPSCVLTLLPAADECNDAGVCSASCDDGVRGPSETGVDCGGDCARRCDEGVGCEDDRDCASGLSCALDSRVCVSVSCADGTLNGSERAVDCGGGSCPGCGVGAPCRSGVDCLTSICGADARCAPGRCDDAVRNQDESDVDCGGSCAPCPPSRACGEDADCAAGSCQNGLCPASPCADGVRNGSESDLDCGGDDTTCRRCLEGERCAVDGDCQGSLCSNGVCASCADGRVAGAESDVDCGGVCGGCAPGLRCNVDADCDSDACEDGRCCGGVLVDCTRCARRLVDTPSCESATDPGAVSNCNRFLDCLADNANVCTVRHAQGCSVDPGGVCPHTAFGGNGGPGLVLADSILGSASCFF